MNSRMVLILSTTSWNDCWYVESYGRHTGALQFGTFPAQLSVELLAKGCLKLLAGEVQLASGSFSLGIRRNGSGSGFVPDSLRCWQLASYVHAWMSERRSPSSFMPT
ncbi:mCG6463 [Mus musculus]|uniref:Uncharacterized protein n=1 Tax=Mus musculus TaxID=10090 RepID=Q9DA88_MOUSE|nr:mCG6463 [Mus musculus]BAB24392.1 unnamed protein product [Mus musculus]